MGQKINTHFFPKFSEKNLGRTMHPAQGEDVELLLMIAQRADFISLGNALG